MVDSNSHHWSYDIMKQLICNHESTPDLIEDLKSLFDEEIGSARRLSLIENLEDLLDALEQQGIFSESDVSSLHEIAVHLHDTKLIKKIEQYKPEPEIYENQYAIQRLKADVRDKDKNHHASRETSNPTDANAANSGESAERTLSGNTKDIVYRLIIREIGKKWRDFGRELGIREGEMDMLEAEHPRDFRTRMYALFSLFEEEERESMERRGLRICESLELCRRRDLRIMVERVLSRR